MSFDLIEQNKSLLEELNTCEVTTILDVEIPRESILGLQEGLFEGIKEGKFIDTVEDQPLNHSFIPGAYARQMIILKDTLIIGKIHIYPCFNFILKGTVTVFSEDGIKKIFAPFFFTSIPGAKRAVYAHEETLWITVHGTNKTDLIEIEEELIAPTYEDLVPQCFKDFTEGLKS